MQTFKQFLDESINDAGILKAIFVVGLPGAGKSYTVKRLSGGVQPVVVNTDKAAEFLAKKLGARIDSQTWHKLFGDKSMRITSTMLENYLNSLLPLFVDGTSNDVSRIVHRIGILESIGYDVGVIHVAVDLETALQRAKDRAAAGVREVDEDFIREVSKQNEDNVAYLRSKVHFFKELRNDGSLDDAAMLMAFKATQGFFNSSLQNPVGKRALEKIRAAKAKYLTPTVMSDERLTHLIQGWYK